MGFSGVSGGSGLTLKASTVLAGFAMVNGTPVILTWTAPNDGKEHRVQVMMVKHITVLEVGGAVQLNYLIPDGTANNHTPYAGGEAANIDEEQEFILVQPGSTVTLQQTSALTSGASKLWAEFWAM